MRESDDAPPEKPFRKTFSAAAYLRISCPPVDDLLAPIIPMDGVAMMSGEKGVGKTFLAMSIAMAVASGKDVFGWSCTQKRSVFFVEPELTVSIGQARLNMIAESQGLSCMPRNLTIWSAAAQYPEPRPNLARPSQIEAMVRQCGRYDLLVIDSLSALVRGVDLNTAQAFETIEDLLIRLRHNGTAVLLVQHLGKDASRGPRGTSKQEDLLDTSLLLKKSSSQGGNTTIRVSCRKIRNHAEAEFVPLEISFGNHHGLFKMNHRPVVSAKKEQVISRYKELEADGLVERGTLTQISHELGVSPSQVTKAVQAYKRSLRDF